ncbi:hypothetical protein SAMN05192588_0485 [Nonlabens sp. Hel1_33_55]|uniref:hypothetical protein n=1 Tax=Nonlabens sp. Hel1_33_55 TaxID=1336802 RepID=UPI000875AA4F|nr:hypothetical protein [Nonlabens sp. Hel1_33_55]SCX96808.1 hypothetical protein SAMN05192588_0485 [Nonlabens sp. Hel1_33_55]
MKYQISIDDVSNIDEIENKWNHDDYVNLLELFEFGDTGDASDQDLKELLYLAISEYEPQEAAEIVLRYKFNDEMNDGQYDQVSNDMLKENVAEKHSDISLHSRLFDVNEFLYKAYNGKFPHAKATVIQFTAKPLKENTQELKEDDVLRMLCTGIDPHAIVQRLYKDQISGEEEFPEAEDILWYFEKTGDHSYQIITSDYWINNEDFIKGEFEAKLIIEEED